MLMMLILSHLSLRSQPCPLTVLLPCAILRSAVDGPLLAPRPYGAISLPAIPARPFISALPTTRRALPLTPPAPPIYGAHPFCPLKSTLFASPTDRALGLTTPSDTTTAPLRGRLVSGGAGAVTGGGAGVSLPHPSPRNRLRPTAPLDLERPFVL
jgi:hypothetical protein